MGQVVVIGVLGMVKPVNGGTDRSSGSGELGSLPGAGFVGRGGLLGPLPVSCRS